MARSPRGAKRKKALFREKALLTQLGIGEDRSGPAPKAPWFDAGVGLIVGGRYFTFAEEPAPSPVRCYTLAGPDQTGTYGAAPVAGCPRFASSAVAGLRLDATVFPLARVPLGA